LLTFNAKLLHAFALVTLAGITLSKTPFSDGFAGLFVLTLLLGAVSFPLGILTELIFWFSPARETLLQARDQGDRRLRTAIERRTGSIIPIKSWKLAWIMGTTVFLPFFFRDLFAMIGTSTLLSSKLLVICITTPVVGAFGGLFFFPLLWISEKLIGSQRILVHRLEASLTRGQERKATGPGSGSPPG
jgi:hypothetical protein